MNRHIIYHYRYHIYPLLFLSSKTGTTVDFANGHGTASARFGLKLSVSLKIGYFDTHYFDIFIRWNGLNNNIVQTLNTQMSTISSGYDIAYSPGKIVCMPTSFQHH